MNQPALPPVIKTIEVPCDQARAFDTFISHVDQWWPRDKNSVSAMQGEVAKQIVMETEQGGKIYEVGFDDTIHDWGTVAVYQPHDLIELNWHIGMPAENASLVQIRFESLESNRTRVELTHTGWEAFGDKAEDMRNGYNDGWVGVFETAFKAACDT